MTDIKASQISMQYPKGDGTVIALNDLNVDFHRGELTVIVGPSGCGKSTLLRILTGALRPTTGSVEIDRDRKLRTAHIEQQPALLPWRTALQNATLGCELRGEFNQTVQRRALEHMEEFGLDGFHDALPGQLSGGMQQRVSIIRALESRPSVLFCDEPFSAIDFVSRLRLNTVFKRRCRLLGCTTVFITHNIEEAIFLADRILVMSKRPGRIVDDFRPSLSCFHDDAIRFREAPEFQRYFMQIWSGLKDE